MSSRRGQVTKNATCVCTGVQQHLFSSNTDLVCEFVQAMRHCMRDGCNLLTHSLCPSLILAFRSFGHTTSPLYFIFTKERVAS